MMLLDLADACRTSGLDVIEEPGWETRGHGPMVSVETLVLHHTGTAASAPGDYPSLGIVRDGRPGLDGPLAQLGLTRAGKVRVIAAGLCYHAGVTFLSRQSNPFAIGIEAEHDGISPWDDDQVAAYAALAAALVRWPAYSIPLDHVEGHKEVAKPLGRKIDPNFDVAAFRRRVAAVPTHEETDDMTPEQAATLDALAADVKALRGEVRDFRRTVNVRTDAARVRDINLALSLREQGQDVDQIKDAVLAENTGEHEG